MSDILAKLLHLSSETLRPKELIARASAVLMETPGMEVIAIAEATPPDWSIIASRGVAAIGIPIELAAESLEQERAVRRDGWIAAPVNGTHALIARGQISESHVDTIAEALGNAIAIATERFNTHRRAARLEAILHITHEWQKTSDMSTLLVQMAQAATKMFDADRASIFLWDRSTRTIVGRPALGIADGELRLQDHAGVVGQVIHTGEPRRVAAIDATEIDRSADKQTGYRTNTILCVPLDTSTGERLGAFELLNKHNGTFTAEDERGLIELASFAAVALDNTQQFERLLIRTEQLVDQAAQDTFLVGNSPAIQAIQSTVRRIADTDLAVLVLGENGTGKEVVSRAIHFSSRRRGELFVPVNCASLTESLLESELFGHEKGAFTDAHETRPGKFEAAAGGTLLLDEIGDMSLSGQAKLLRVLEDKTIVRVGGNREIVTDVRVLAATNQNLAELVRARRFREDLFFRLNVVSIVLPPLRDRGDDIEVLAEHFLRDFCRKAGRRNLKLTAAARKRLISHSWPGNVRELRNLMERLAYLSSGDKVDAEDLAFILAPGNGVSAVVEAGQSLNDATDQFQTNYISQSIERAQGNVSLAAKNLGVHRSNLYRKMRQLGMSLNAEEID